jgi:hypothetical protein
MRNFRARALRLAIALVPFALLAMSMADNYCNRC